MKADILCLLPFNWILIVIRQWKIVGTRLGQGPVPVVSLHHALILHNPPRIRNQIFILQPIYGLINKGNISIHLQLERIVFPSRAGHRVQIRFEVMPEGSVARILEVRGFVGIYS